MLSSVSKAHRASLRAQSQVLLQRSTQGDGVAPERDGAELPGLPMACPLLVPRTARLAAV